MLLLRGATTTRGQQQILYLRIMLKIEFPEPIECAMPAAHRFAAPTSSEATTSISPMRQFTRITCFRFFGAHCDFGAERAPVECHQFPRSGPSIASANALAPMSWAPMSCRAEAPPIAPTRILTAGERTSSSGRRAPTNCWASRSRAARYKLMPGATASLPAGASGRGPRSRPAPIFPSAEPIYLKRTTISVQRNMRLLASEPSAFSLQVPLHEASLGAHPRRQAR